MAVPNADELADALMKMASGEISLDDEPAGSAFGETLIDPAPGIRPAPPIAISTPGMTGGSATDDSARPVRPAAPQRRPAPPPEALPLPPMPEVVAPLVAEAVDKPTGRSMIADFEPAAGSLAPDMDLTALARAGDVFAPAGQSTGRSSVRQPVYQSDEFRRTLIPVLGVSGILLFVLATSCYCVRPESPLTGLPPWMPPVLFVAGAVLLLLAILNMLSVRASRAARR